ncbi:carbohydrate sulfotransferase 11-like [Mercenaria mercenaria]|uniref:carbohydrate sulfotransferase 11-like n=1 Tax=Mercenaria mercenaria TaxID=6596 RepID=UPI00234ECA4A|nr:carbohydrate sulfotransferase 11-like [Mercenaria mercenaria]
MKSYLSKGNLLRFFIVNAVVSFLFYAVWPEETDRLFRFSEDQLQQAHGASVANAQIGMFDEVSGRNAERLNIIREQCSLLGKPRQEETSKLKLRTLCNPSHSVIYCRVNKAASTFIIDTLAYVLNCSADCLRNSSLELYSLPEKYVKDILQKTAYSFMFVREPYGRLFATYCNKFYFPKGFWTPVGLRIVKRFRENPSNDSLQYGHDVTFTELIRYTVEEFEAGKSMDDHITPMHVRCDPCEHRYNFIGKLETIKSDLEFLANEWQLKKISKRIPEKISEKNNSKTFRPMEYFQALLQRLKLEQSSINTNDLYKRAWRYYQITGKIYKHINMPCPPTYLNESNFKDFFKEMKLAVFASNVSATELKAQKEEAMLEAYSKVPLKYLYRLRKVVLKDCLFFGYDDRPKWLFNRTSSKVNKSSFNYFS